MTAPESGPESGNVPRPAAQDASPVDAVEELMSKVLLSPAAGLQAAVADACARHPELADALRRRFLLLVGGGFVGAADDDDDHDRPPERIGPFRILGRLGGGGMGIVWRAREEPVERDVALKLIRPEHTPFAAARARFLREIRIVAGLSHAGIVPVFSYGEEQGLLYYAMELVAGGSLAERLAALSGKDPAVLPADSLGVLDQARPQGYVAACCALVRQLALALQHAHERGVVHRDVKPSNVMLADDGRARVIDFGLARAVGDATVTRGGSQPGSLAYMSPEQVRGEDVDARSDVYSLGLTLYEMLSLRSPFLADTEERTRRLVLQAEAPPLRSFNPAVPWEVIAICATAMAPERERRYPTMTALADDLAAFLARRPIRARSPGPLLRARRFAQRRPALVTGVVLGFVIAAGLPTALWLKERSAHEAIVREAQRTRRVADFLQSLLHEAQPDTARGTTLTTRGFLERCVKRVRKELEEEPALRGELLDVLGRLLRSVGLLRLSEEALREGVELMEKHPGPDPSRLVEVRVYLANALMDLGDYAEAESLYRGWLASRRDQPRAWSAGSLCQLGEAAVRQGRAEEGLGIIEEAVDALKGESTPNLKQLGYALLKQARVVHMLHGPVRALPHYEEARDVMERSVEGPAMRKVATLPYVASCLAELGRHREAEALYRAALDMARRLFDEDHPHLAQARREYAAFLLAQGRIVQARAEIDPVIAAFRRAYGGPHFELADALNLDSRLRHEAGDLPGAGRAADEALAMYEQIAPNGHRDFAMALTSLAFVHMAGGGYRKAEELARRSLAMQESIGLRREDDLAVTRAHLAYILALEGKFADAEEHARASRAKVDAFGPGLRSFLDCQAAEVLLLAGRGAEAEPLARAAHGRAQDAKDPDRRRIAWALHLVGWARNQQGDSPAAEPLLQQAMALRTQTCAEGHPLLAISHNELGVALARQGKNDAARTELEKALAIRRKALAADDPFLALSLLNLGSLHARSGRDEEAEALLLESLRALARRELRDDYRAVAAIRLLVDIVGRRGAAATAAATRTELAAFAEQLLSPGHELAVAVERL